MGPSGAGKTTVINLITGKARRSGGAVRINGSEVAGLTQIAKLVGFVPQEDVMLRELTVRDNISFSAKYRLPAALPRQAVEAKINHCINELGISHVQHSVIGDERTRGISGGQRKRVNIGIELVADPSILFLDEVS
jgi:ABC-type multidrug transport system ATPase subunit